MRKLSIITLILALAVAPAAVAAPERAPTPEAVASARVAGTMLVVSPKVTYSSATLRVAGPEGYQAIAWSQGGELTLDLLADSRRNEREGDKGTPTYAMVDGEYGYEALFDLADGSQWHESGRFSVRDGVPFLGSNAETGTRLEGRSPTPASIGSEADGTEGFYSIRDENNSDNTYLSMANRVALDPDESYFFMGIRHHNHALQFWDNQLPNGHVPLVTILPNGRTGIGTTLPQRKLHVLDDAPGLRLEHTSSGQRWDLEATSTHFAMVNVTESEFPFLLREGGPIIHSTGGGVGIGTAAPQQELHIVSSDGGDIRLSGSPQGELWQIGTSSTGGQLTFFDANTSRSVIGLEMGAPQASIWVAPAGVGVGTAAPTAKLHVAGSGRIDGDVALGSSRTLKTGFGTVDSAEVLARVADLPVASWRYKSESEDARHIGPFAEDFQRLFGLGDGETISVIDAQGVTLAAIQGLQEELAEKDAEIAALTARLTAVEAHLDATR